ncbi:MAG: hypothetical protein KAF91_26380 [Nostoc sp. TH1S01]|nr:hypothetical protein [Nostoc sp. TH1S01]
MNLFSSICKILLLADGDRSKIYMVIFWSDRHLFTYPPRLYIKGVTYSPRKIVDAQAASRRVAQRRTEKLRARVPRVEQTSGVHGEIRV